METKRTVEVHIQETSSFEERVEEAARDLLHSGNATIEIPEADGMILARDGTPEAEERKRQPGMVIKKTRLEEQDFLICHK